MNAAPLQIKAGSQVEKGRKATQRRVLIVDDDPDCRALLGQILSDEGYMVRAAWTGITALAILLTWRPDLILLDLVMPDMNGWVFRRAQLATPDIAAIPVLVVSAVPLQVIEHLGLADLAVLAKPFDLEVLVRMVDQLTRPAITS